MTNKEILERLKAVIKQERAFYQCNENLRISDEEAAEELEGKIGTIVHVGLHLFGGLTPEYTELNKFAFGEHQVSFEEYLYKAEDKG
jgi:hypothetical protein